MYSSVPGFFRSMLYVRASPTSCESVLCFCCWALYHHMNRPYLIYSFLLLIDIRVAFSWGIFYLPVKFFHYIYFRLHMYAQDLAAKIYFLLCFVFLILITQFMLLSRSHLLFHVPVFWATCTATNIIPWCRGGYGSSWWAWHVSKFMQLGSGQAWVWTLMVCI